MGTLSMFGRAGMGCLLPYLVALLQLVVIRLSYGTLVRKPLPVRSMGSDPWPFAAWRDVRICEDEAVNRRWPLRRTL